MSSATAVPVLRAAVGDPAVHRDLLSSWWTVVVLGLLAVGLVVRAALRRRRGRHVPAGAAKTRAWPSVVAAALVAVLAAGAGVNAVQGWVPDVAGARLRLGLGSDRATQVRIAAPDELRIPEQDAWVWTPPGYDPADGTRYPVLYLLHGSPGGAVDWMAAGLPGVLDTLTTSGRVRPMIVVAPDVNAVGTSDASCLDSTRGGSQVETYLEDVVVPWVDAHYPTVDDWRARGIGGMSAGAYCALDQGLRHPELYGTILAISPYGAPGSGGAFQLSTDAQVAAHSPSAYADSVPLPHALGVLLAYGSAEADDEVGRTARDLAPRLADRGVDVELLELPGRGHSWATALAALPAGVGLFDRRLAAEGVP